MRGKQKDICPESSFSRPLGQYTFLFSTPVPVTQEATHEDRLYHSPCRHDLVFLDILVPILSSSPFSPYSLKHPHRRSSPSPTHWGWRPKPKLAGPTPCSHCGLTSRTIVHLKGVSFHLLVVRCQFFTWNQETLVICLKGKRKPEHNPLFPYQSHSSRAATGEISITIPCQLISF